MLLVVRGPGRCKQQCAITHPFLSCHAQFVLCAAPPWRGTGTGGGHLFARVCSCLAAFPLAPAKPWRPASAPVSSTLPAQVAQATALNDYLHPALPPSVIAHLKKGEADLDNKVDMAIDAINAHDEATHSPEQITVSYDNLHPALPPSVIAHLKKGEADLANKVDMAVDAINSHTLSGMATHSPYPALPPAVVKHLNDFEDNLTKHVDVYVNAINALDSKVNLAPAPSPSMHYRRMRA